MGHPYLTSCAGRARANAEKTLGTLDSQCLRARIYNARALSHVWVANLINDIDVQYIILVCPYQSTRELPVDQDGVTCKAIWGNVRILDVEVIVNIISQSRAQCEEQEKQRG
jgi:hypothetical protein